MASQRITAHIRDALVQGALEMRFEKEDRELEKLEREVESARREYYKNCYKDAFTSKDRKIISSLPDGWLPTATVVCVQVDGLNVTKFEFGEKKPIPHKFAHYGRVTRIVNQDCDALVSKRVYYSLKEDLSQKRARLFEGKNRLSVKIKSVIGSVTTTNRLLEIWPECAKLLPANSQPAGAMLPAINLKDLNKEIGL